MNIIFVLLMFLMPFVARSQQKDWSVYYNEAFEYEFEYPSNLYDEDSRDKAGYKRFVSADGESIISVYALVDTLLLDSSLLLPMYEADLQMMDSTHVYVFYCELFGGKNVNNDGSYIIQGYDNGNFFYKRVIVYDEFLVSASVSYPSRLKTKYGKYAEKIVMSLSSMRATFEEYTSISESIGSVWMNDTIDVNLYDNSYNLIKDYFIAFGMRYPFFLTEAGMSRLDTLYATVDDHIDIWIVDTTNCYIYCGEERNLGFWLEMKCWEMSDGNSLLAISINDPYQVIFFYKYDLEKQILIPAVNILNQLDYNPDYVARLPRDNDDILLYNQLHLDIPVAILRWNGKCFEYME